MPIGVVLLIYLLLGRFAYDFKHTFDPNSPYNELDPTISISKGLLLDLCPFVAFFLPVTMIIDPTRKTTCVLAFYGIFGGLITFFGEFI